MEAMNALTPNTAAFLDSLTMGDLDNNNNNSVNNMGFPPSTFFPVPGRDTPEDSSPDSIADVKPKAPSNSDDSDHDVAGNHKRKQGDEHDDDDEDDDSMSEGGHEDKREKKGAGRRKSGDKAKGDKPPKDNLTKAQRRKEQNRAAQKAFRERREAKVRDLEQKVAELEAKYFGASVENENLRGILRRLQEENMTLKQSHFTFSMPINGAPNNGQQTPTQANSGNPIDWSTFSTFKAQGQVPKPPSPPQSVNENLRSINDPSPVHRTSVGSMSDNSPESLVSINGPSPSSSSDRNGMPSLFSGLNSTAPTPGLNPGLNRNNSTSSPSDILTSTPSSVGGTNKDDVEALFRSLYPNGIDAVLANATNATSYTAAGTTSSTGPQPLPAPSQTPYTFIGSQQGLQSYADSSSNALAKLFGEPTSYRDSSATQSSLDTNNNTMSGFMNNSSSFSSSQPQMSTLDGPLASQAAWSNMTENSVNDFLASLTGTNNNTNADPGDLSGAVDDDVFSHQIAALLSAQSNSSPSSGAFNLNSTFSPTAYLNMSPSPLQSMSNSQTPQSNSQTPQSNSQTPQSTNGTSSVTSPQTDASSVSEAPICGGSDIIHVIGDDGRVMRPSELWTKMGMHNSTTPGDLLIDDLCDQMKSKATCKDGRRYMKFDDVQEMVRQKEDKGHSRFGDRETTTATKKSPNNSDNSATAGTEPCKDKAYHDPALCQARLNAMYVEANGGL